MISLIKAGFELRNSVWSLHVVHACFFFLGTTFRLRALELFDVVQTFAGIEIRRWVHCGDRRMDRNNTQVGCGV